MIVSEKAWRIVTSCTTLDHCKQARQYLRIAHTRALDGWRRGGEAARKEVHLIEKIGNALLVREEMIYQQKRHGQIEDGRP